MLGSSVAGGGALGAVRAGGPAAWPLSLKRGTTLLRLYVLPVRLGILLGEHMSRSMSLLLFAAALAPACWADPCEGELPSKVGTVFAGSVRYIVDGDGLCVGPSADVKTWVEVRLTDFDAPELNTPEGKRGKAILEDLVKGRDLTCVTSAGRNGNTTSYDRVFAVCQLGGTAVGDLLRKAGAPKGGN